MKLVPHRAGPEVNFAGIAKIKGKMIRAAVVSAVLLVALTIIVSAVAAQKRNDPPGPNPINGRGSSALQEEKDAGNKTPRILRQYTIKLESNCSLDPLSAALSSMLAEGELKEAPILTGKQMRIVVEDAHLADLSALPCVQEIVQERRDSHGAAQLPAPGAGSNYVDTVPDITGAAAAAGTVSGAVTAEDGGLPLPDITVEVYNYPGPETGWALFSSDETGSDGLFSIAGLPAGIYRVGFFDWLSGTFVGEFFDDVFNLNIASNVGVSDGATTQDINAALSAPGQISGTVESAAGGALLEGIAVHAYKQNASGWEQINSGATMVDGTYVVGDLPSGIYQVQFVDSGGLYLEQYYDGVFFRQDSDDVPVSGGLTTPNIDASLDYAGHITGTVTAESGGASLIDIEVCALVSKDSHWETLSCDNTDSLGQYDVGNLPAGIYRVAFEDHNGDYNGEYFDNALELSNAVDVSVSAGGTTQDIDAALSSAGHIIGTVTAEVGGAPLMDIRVCALSFRNFDWRSVICDYTDAGGQYDIGYLPTANYRVEFHDHTGKYIDEYYINSLNVFRAPDVSVTAGSTVANINAALAQFGQIAGMVTAEDGGAPLENITVCASYVGLYSVERSRCAFTGANGSYEISNLHPGTYNVDFFDHSYNYVREFYDSVPVGTSPTAVIVTGGQTKSAVNASMKRYGSIAGTVTDDAGGTPLETIHVYAYTHNGAEWIYAGRGDTNANGDYDIGPLATGDYLVEYYDSDGLYVTEYFDDFLNPDLAGHVSVSAGSISQGIDAELALAVSHDIALLAGWNMISSYVQPGDPDLETLFEEIEHDVVLMKNGDGEVYWPALRINQIGGWNAHHGYLIYMDNPATLSISGAAIQPQKSPIDLASGWNLVAYLRSSAMPAEQALDTINSQLYLAKNGSGEAYWPEFAINQFGDMQPGQGYQMYMNNSGSLTYPSD